ncbi:MAG: ribonuclease [Coprothermobacter sp.]|nr:ribonuclease [Coprothermobacter sp.]
MKKTESWRLLKDLYARFVNDDVLSTGAEVAFFLLLSLFPFLIFLMTLVSYVQIVDVQDSMQVLAALMPASAYEILRDIVNETIADRSGTLLSLGVLFALWSSTSGVTSLMRGINRAYDQEETRRFWRMKAISLGFTVELAVVIAVSFVLVVLGRILGTRIFQLLGFSDVSLDIWNYGRLAIVTITSTLMFMFFYHVAPNCRLKLREVIPGAVVASIGWVTVSLAFSYYANNLGSYSKVYGSLGGIIALLMWMYLSSISILMGAEVNASLMFTRTGGEKPKFKRF